MTNFRKRLKKGGAECLLEETIKAGLKLGAIKDSSLNRISVDTTVQEKNISFPTDAKLYYRGIDTLQRLIKKYDIPVRQNYRFAAKKILREASRSGHARKTSLLKKKTKKLRTFLGRLIRDIDRNWSGEQSEEVINTLCLADQLYHQDRKGKHKLYSFHEPSVQCIAKGKAGKKYEFGSKVGIATTMKEGFIVGSVSVDGRPADCKTLNETMSQTEQLMGRNPKQISVDLGYRGHDYEGPAEVVIRRHTKHKNNYQKRIFRRHSLIEAVIGHLKCQFRFNRNRLWGSIGDKMNAILSASAYNMKYLMRFIAKSLSAFLEFLQYWFSISVCLINQEIMVDYFSHNAKKSICS